MSSSETWKARDRIDAAWRVRGDQQDLIKFADQKVGAVLALSAVLTGFVMSNLRVLVASGSFALLLVTAFLVVTLGLLISALRALLARVPVASEAGDAPIAGDCLPKVVYFGHIGERSDADRYWKDFAALGEQDLLRDLCHQNWELSRIAGEKYQNYRYAWRWMQGQLAVFLLVVIFLVNTDPPRAERSSARGTATLRVVADGDAGRVARS